MDSHLLPLFNKVRDVINKVSLQSINGESSSSDIDISFPRIVVIGSQSAGKSSVLEALVRRDFLPRSNGICTRRPLELRLHNISSSLSKKISIDDEGDDKNIDSTASSTEKKRQKKDDVDEYAIFGHLPEKRFTDFELVKEEIIKQTTEVAGSDRGISNVPIILEIFSPKVVPLSLVDLPGVTKVPVGNQPPDIEILTEELALKYIKEEDTIILAVTAANVDIANSDAIKLAKKVDPKGLRTIGVLTKLDLMDKGTDAKEILTGRGDIVLRHGFIGVVCRSQADSNKTIDDAIEKESEYLSYHYGSIAKVNGSLYLGRRLSELLIGSIKKELPNIREKIRRQLQSVNENIKALGDPVGADHNTRSRILLSLLASYAEIFSLSIDGDSSGSSNNGNYMKEVCGGARISHCFSESFEKQILKLSPLEGLDDEMIHSVIAGSNGLETSLSVPERAFRKLVHSQIKQLKSPCIQLVDMINDELQRIAIQSETSELKRFRILNEKVSDVVRSFLDAKAEETRQMVSNIINIELSHINTRHPSFDKDVLFHPSESRRRGSFSHIQKSSSFQLPGFDSSHDKNPRSRLQNGLPSPPLMSSDSAHSIVSEPILLQPRNDSDMSTSANDSATEAAANKASSGVGSFFFNIYQSSKSNGSKSASSTPTPFKLAPISYNTDFTEVSADDEVDRGVAIVKSLLESYMNIVHTTLMDMIPKTIICFLVNASKSEIHHMLMTSLYKEDLIESLLEEDEDIAIERRRLTRIREALNEASALLMDMKELKSSLPLV